MMVAQPLSQPLVVRVVPMRRRHLRGVLRIERQVYPRPWSMSLFLTELGMRETRAYHVAIVGRGVVGYVGLMMTLDEGHITTVAVDPLWQRHKVATRLMLVSAREAIKRGAVSLTLEVRLSNKEAQEMYRQFGFKPVGVRKGYYVETGEDALIMWVEDINTGEYRKRLAAIEARTPGMTFFEEGSL